MFSFWFSKFNRRQKRKNAHSPERQQATRRRPRLESLEGRAMMTFLSPASYLTGTSPAGVAAGDANGDGWQDMAVVDQATSSVGILLSNGDGTFHSGGNYPAGAGAIDAVFGDFNSDGKLDLGVVGTSNLDVLAGNGDGTFGAPAAYAVGSGSHSIAKGDFNGDGQLDLATMNYGTASVLLNNGDGTFQPHRDAFIPGNSTNAVVGDYNRDGYLDLATSNTMSTGTITLLRGHGDGSFDAAANIYAFSAPVYLGAGDFNHDGYDDFAVANSYAASSMSVIMNNGDGTYAPPQTYGIGQTGYEIEVEDFDGDGNEDYAVRGASQYMVHLGKGDGTFYAEVGYATPSGRFEAGTHGDFNGDGAVDFAYPSTSGVTVVMNANDSVTNLSTATGFTISAPASTTSGSLLPLTVTVVDDAGNAVPDFQGVIYLSSSDPASTATFSYRFSAADAGTHTFTGAMRLMTVGPQTVTVSSPMLGSASQTVNVTPAISRLGIDAPAASTAGDTFNVTVTAYDALGNVGTGYASTIHFSTSDVQAGLPADYTFTPEDAGVHTFAVTLKSAGSRFVSATEVGRLVNGGAFVNVTPAAVSTLQLAGAGGAIGVARPVTIVGRDVYGNLASGYTGTVHFTSSDPAAVLPGDTTLVGGVATVNATFYTIGTQTITATDVSDASLSGTLSSDATPPVAALFTLSDYPATAAGVANNFTVTVRDTIGQVATGYTGTIYFSSSDVRAGLPASYTFTAADAGVHTFSATLKTAGTQLLTAYDSTGTLVGSQVGINVSAAAFASYQLSVPLGADSKGHMLVTAGDNIALTVRAIDAFGNSAANYTGKVKFSSTDTLAGLPTDYNFTAADAGVHTFQVVLKTVTPNGVVWSFSVVDANNAATLATITNFEVNNAAAAKFTLSAPSNANAGTAFSVKVSVLDAYGNRVKNYFGTVHLAATGIAGLPEDYTFNSLDAGDHSFSVTLNTVGNQTLSVTDLASALSSSAIISVKTASTGGGGGGGGGGSGGSGGGGGKKTP